MRKNFLVLGFLILVFGAGFATNPVIDTMVLNYGVADTNSETINVNLAVTWGGCDGSTAKQMGFGCKVDSVVSFSNYEADYSLHWVSQPDCHTVNGQKTIFAWVQCDSDPLTMSAGKSGQINFDNTQPIVTITTTQPQTTQTISFDLTDNFCGINLNSVTVEINGAPSAAFNPVSCSATGSNYTCTYIETGLPLYDGTYPIKITVKDNTGNQKVHDGTITYVDSVAPFAPATGSCPPGAGSVQLSWTKNSEADIYKYNVYRHTTTAVPKADGNRVMSFLHSSCAGTNCQAADANGIAAGTTYYYGITAVDKSGDESGITLVSTGCSPTNPSISGTPAISSSTHPRDTWKSSDDPQFFWSAVTGGTSTVIYYFALNQTESYNPTTADSSTTDTNRGFSDRDNGTWYFHVRAYNEANWSNVDHYKIKIDDVNPAMPSNFAVAVRENSYVRITWSEPSDSGGSGLDKYYLVRALEGDSLDKSNYDERFTVEDPADETYDDEDLASNRTYCYRIYSVDVAGNESDLSSKRCIDFKKESVTISINAPETVNADKMDFSVSSTGGTMKGCYVMIKKAQDSDFENIGGYFTNTSSISRSYTFESGDHGIAELKVECANGTKTRNVKVDTSKPTVSWVAPSSRETVKGSVDLVAEARDVSYGLKEVSFYADGLLVSKTSSAFETNRFKVTWNAALLSGSHALKVVAEDNAGNTAEAQISVTVEKQEEPADKNAQTAISAAESAKALAQKKTEEFTGKGLFVPASMDSLKKEADPLLVSAKSFLAQKDFANAEKNANSAKEKYNKIAADYPIAEFSSKEIKYGSVEAGAFDGVLFSNELAGEAAANLADANAARKLLVFKTTEGGIEKYVIAVELVFTNKTGGSTVQLVEVIPKELAKSSDEISSLLPFEVLVSDPIIKFNVKVEPGETAKIAYFLKTAVSKEALQDLNNAGALQPSQKPLMPFRAETLLESAAFGAKTGAGGAGDTAGFAVLGGDMLPLVGIIIIFALALFLFYLFSGKRKRYFEFDEEAKGRHKGGKWGYKGR